MACNTVLSTVIYLGLSRPFWCSEKTSPCPPCSAQGKLFFTLFDGKYFKTHLRTLLALFCCLHGPFLLLIRVRVSPWGSGLHLIFDSLQRLLFALLTKKDKYRRLLPSVSPYLSLHPVPMCPSVASYCQIPSAW